MHWSTAPVARLPATDIGPVTRRCAVLFVLLAAASSAATGARAQTRPLVVIDPGHGGEEIGVEVDGWLEKDLVLQIAFVIGAELVDAGFDVVYTRTRDVAVAWPDRRRIAEEAGASMLLMLHANRSEDAGDHGAEVYVSEGQAHSAQFADGVGAALRAAGSAVVVEGREWEFLASPDVATAMIELAFMTNPDDRRRLQTSEFHHELGEALAGAARGYVGSER